VSDPPASGGDGDGPRLARLTVGQDELLVLSVPAGPPAGLPALTVAEQDVAARLLAGASAGDIALARGTSVRTVNNQLQGLYRKLGVCGREELAMLLLAGVRPPRPGEGGAP
jgi:DNA-binding CsgD family transcriptional regulator